MSLYIITYSLYTVKAIYGKDLVSCWLDGKVSKILKLTCFTYIHIHVHMHVHVQSLDFKIFICEWDCDKIRNDTCSCLIESGSELNSRTCMMITHKYCLIISAITTQFYKDFSLNQQMTRMNNGYDLNLWTWMCNIIKLA